MKKTPSGDSKGRRAENVAELLLRLKAYKIVARRFKTGQGEVDLIAQRGRSLAFIEVKYRPSHTAAAEAVGPRQRRRILDAAHAFLAQNPRAGELNCRFDVILVTDSLIPHHILNAWSASDDNAW